LGKQKQKNKSEVTYLRGEVRRLKAKLAQKMPMDAEIADEDRLAPTPNCKVCAKGYMTLVLEVLGREFYSCSVCDAKEMKRVGGS